VPLCKFIQIIIQPYTAKVPKQSCTMREVSIARTRSCTGGEGHLVSVGKEAERWKKVRSPGTWGGNVGPEENQVEKGTEIFNSRKGL